MSSKIFYFLYFRSGSFGFLTIATSVLPWIAYCLQSDSTSRSMWTASLSTYLNSQQHDIEEHLASCIAAKKKKKKWQQFIAQDCQQSAIYEVPSRLFSVMLQINKLYYFGAFQSNLSSSWVFLYIVNPMQAVQKCKYIKYFYNY